MVSIFSMLLSKKSSLVISPFKILIFNLNLLKYEFLDFDLDITFISLVNFSFSSLFKNNMRYFLWPLLKEVFQNYLNSLKFLMQLITY